MSDADVKLDIGRQLTRGLGAGSDPEVGRQAAEDHRDEIEEVLKGADMVFITAGEGGGTGTGGAPDRRRDRARPRRAHDRDRDPAVRLRGSAPRGAGRRGHPARCARRSTRSSSSPTTGCSTSPTTSTSMLSAFRMADDVLFHGVQGITDLITTPGLINTDFADVRMIMQNAGSALMGIGHATGDGRAVNAARAAISSPLLEASLEGARGLLLNVSGPSDLGLFEVNEAAEIVARPRTPTPTSSSVRSSTTRMGDEVRITVIAAGLRPLRRRARRDARDATRRRCATAVGRPPDRAAADLGARRRPRRRRRRDEGERRRVRRPRVPALIERAPRRGARARLDRSSRRRLSRAVRHAEPRRRTSVTIAPRSSENRRLLRWRARARRRRMLVLARTRCTARRRSRTRPRRARAEPPEADAAVTDVPGLPARRADGRLRADRPRRRRRGRGRACRVARPRSPGVVEAAVAALRDVGPGRVRAVIGPCIRPHTTSSAAPTSLGSSPRFGPAVEARTRRGAPALDLPGGGADRVRRGRRRRRASTSDVCTVRRPPTTSRYRRDGVTGRQALVAVARPMTAAR